MCFPQKTPQCDVIQKFELNPAMTDSDSESSDSTSESSVSASGGSDYVPENAASTPMKTESGTKRQYKNRYTQEQLAEAVMKVQTKELRQTTAAKLYNIPVMTLSDNLKRAKRGKYTGCPILWVSGKYTGCPFVE